MGYPYTGVILAGGLNRRFSGKEKALIQLGETRIIDRIHALFRDLFEETLLITNAPLHYLAWNACIATDILPVRSALAGIHTGLFYASHDHCFVCACDTPFVKREVIELLLDRVEPRWEVVIPETAQGLEPLCAVYSKAMTANIENNLKNNRLKIQQSFRRGRVRKIAESIIQERDPDLLSFFNINTPEDLQTAIAIEKAAKNPNGTC